MTNYISYSLYGADEYYVHGAIENIVNNAKVMPGWLNIIYISQFTFQKFGYMLSEVQCKLVKVLGEDDHISSIWRFFATDLNDAEYILFRDCDSLITDREKAFVDEWLVSNKALHIIRDHPLHQSNIMAGLCGVNKAKVHNLLDVFRNSKLINIYGVDQWFINRELFRKYRHDSLVHDSISLFDFKSLFDIIDYNNSNYIGKRLPRNRFETNVNEYLGDRKSSFKKTRLTRRFVVIFRNIETEIYFRIKIFMFGSKSRVKFD
jgi:hypothetical protein